MVREGQEQSKVPKRLKGGTEDAQEASPVYKKQAGHQSQPLQGSVREEALGAWGEDPKHNGTSLKHWIMQVLVGSNEKELDYDRGQ